MGCAASWTSGGDFLSQTTVNPKRRQPQSLKQRHRSVASTRNASAKGDPQPCNHFFGRIGHKPQCGSSRGFWSLSWGRSGERWSPLHLQEGGEKRFACHASMAEGGQGRDDSGGLLNGGNGQQGRGSFWGAMLEPISTELPDSPHKSLINEDFAPVLREQRSFSLWDLASLWVGLVVGIPTYYMAGSLVEMGMAWWQGILTVLAGNLIVLLPMVLSGHGGTKYGIPFPVLSRAAFGVRGANIPSVLRALVGCGWFGIQTWIGGQAIFQLVNALLPTKLEVAVVPWLGTSFPELSCFLLFWVLQVIGLSRLKHPAPILKSLFGHGVCMGIFLPTAAGKVNLDRVKHNICTGYLDLGWEIVLIVSKMILKFMNPKSGH